MYKVIKESKLGKVLLVLLIIGVGIPIFVHPVNAGPDIGDDPWGYTDPPPILKCKARAKVYSDETLRFIFSVEAWGYVEEYLGGWRLYQFRIFDFGSDDKCSDVWERSFIGGYPVFDSSPGGGTIKGYSQVEIWKIYHTSDPSQYLVFELSAKVHLIYGHSGSVEITTSGDGVCFQFNVSARDTTYDFNPWELLTVEFGYTING